MSLSVQALALGPIPKLSSLNVPTYRRQSRRRIERGRRRPAAPEDSVPQVLQRLARNPGHLAQEYERRGGKVIYFGKPHKEHFEACVAGLGLPKARVAHVGDSMHHDVAGAAAAEVAVIFIAGGIEHERLGVEPGALPTPEAVRRLCDEYSLRDMPTHTAALVQWEAGVM